MSAVQERTLRQQARQGPRFGYHALSVPVLVLWAGFFLGPILLLFLYSFGEISILTFQVSWGWTWTNYQKIFQAIYLETTLRSFVLAAASTVACLLLGLPTAYYMSKQSARKQTFLLLAIVVPWWTSFIVRVYAWVNILRNEGPVADALRAIGIGDGAIDILYSPVSIMIGMVATYLPLMILPLFVALERIDPSLDEAASDLGAVDRRRFRRVTIPLAMPGIVAGCILVGIPAAGEYVIPTILGGGKTLMFGNIVADQFLTVGDYPFGAALATAFMAILTVFLVVTRRRVAELEQVA